MATPETTSGVAVEGAGEGLVEVLSTAGRIMVEFEGRPLGEAPLTVSVAQGKHEFVLVTPAGQRLSRAVVVEAGSRYRMQVADIKAL